MSNSANLGLPFIEAGQAQKHVTHNEALRLLDTLVQLAALDRDLNAPPGSPAEGERWIVKASPAPTGAWAGHGNHVAAWQDGAWHFSAPKTGWVAYVVDEGALLYWDGDSWEALQLATVLQNLSVLGVGTTADATNPVSAKLNNTLWVAKTVAEGGDGNLRYKLSKESAAKTLSFLFQDNFSGRAEIGLTGDDDFHFKVSPDGSSWLEGLKIDRSTGKVSFPASGGPRELLTANRAYYVRTDGSDVNNGLANTTGGAFATVQKALNVITGGIDFGGFTVTVQIGDGTYAPASGTAVANVFPWTGGGALIIQGNGATPANVVLSATGASAVSVLAGALPGLLTVKDFKVTTTTSGYGLNVSTPSHVKFSGIDFGGCVSGHILAAAGAYIDNLGVGSYVISGNAPRHIIAGSSSRVDVSGITVTLTGTPAFSAQFAYAIFGYSYLAGVTWSGSATGTRYLAEHNGIINVGGAGASYLPGNAAGSTATGGQYI